MQTVKNRTVQLADLFIGDSMSRIIEAIENTEDLELLTAYAATNRLIAQMREQHSISHPDDVAEMEHMLVKRSRMEIALLKRMQLVPCERCAPRWRDR